MSGKLQSPVGRVMNVMTNTSIIGTSKQDQLIKIAQQIVTSEDSEMNKISIINFEKHDCWHSKFPRFELPIEICTKF